MLAAHEAACDAAEHACSWPLLHSSTLYHALGYPAKLHLALTIDAIRSDFGLVEACGLGPGVAESSLHIRTVCSFLQPDLYA